MKAPRGVVWRSRTIQRRSRDVAPRRRGAFTPRWDPAWVTGGWGGRGGNPGCGSGPDSGPNLLGMTKGFLFALRYAMLCYVFDSEYFEVVQAWPRGLYRRVFVKIKKSFSVTIIWNSSWIPINIYLWMPCMLCLLRSYFNFSSLLDVSIRISCQKILFDDQQSLGLQLDNVTPTNWARPVQWFFL